MEKNNKKPEVKTVKNEKLTIDDKITIKELEEKLESMNADKEKKCKAAKEQLVDMLEVTVDKYRTATGTAEALHVLRFVVGDESWIDLSWASRLAWDMAAETDRMRHKAEDLGYYEMDQLCDGFYNKEFKIESDDDNEDASYNLAFGMMCIDLCRNVGGSAEDIVEFVKRVDEEIESTQAKLDELKSKKD